MSRAAIRAAALLSWLTASLACWSPLAAQQVAADAWDPEHYNPQPAHDDLMLPMPCDGNMVFRPVEVESTGWLDDMKIELGRSDQELGYKEDRRLTHIAGAFTDRVDAGQAVVLYGIAVKQRLDLRAQLRVAGALGVQEVLPRSLGQLESFVKQLLDPVKSCRWHRRSQLGHSTGSGILRRLPGSGTP